MDDDDRGKSAWVFHGVFRPSFLLTGAYVADSNASSEAEQDEVMEDAEDVEKENEPDEDEDENEEEPEEEEEAEQEEPDAEGPQDTGDGQGKDGVGEPAATRASATPRRTSATPGPMLGQWPRVRPEALTARVYDIVPTMAAPQSTSINAMAITPDLRFWMTGGSDGYIRKYDGPGTINGKTLLTVAQRHPFVDSVVKAGVLMSYWENEEPSIPGARIEDHVPSPVYSLAVHSQALWLLAGTEGGGINLQSVRHDEGKRITCLQGHSNAVSVLQLAPDEKSVLSGSWDKNILLWDLNNGQITRQFDGSGGQISALEPRPASGAPIPQDSYDEPAPLGDTFSSSNANPLPNGAVINGANGGTSSGLTALHGDDGLADAQGSPTHDSESLFGSPNESLFGGNDDAAGGGGNPFGDDNDNEFSQSMDMTMHGDSAQDAMGGAPGDLSMTDMGMSTTQGFDTDNAAPPAVQAPPADENRPAAPPATLSNGEPAAVNGAATSHAPLPSQAETSSSAPSQPDPTALGPSSQPQAASPPSLVFASQPGPTHFDPTQSSNTTFFSSSFDGAIRIWDRRVALPVARIGIRPGVPPWCMGGCWSPDGNLLYAGRRNGTVEEFSIHKARSGWAPERVLKFPAGSGPVSAVRAMVNGRHLVWSVSPFRCLSSSPSPASRRRPSFFSFGIGLHDRGKSRPTDQMQRIARHSPTVRPSRHIVPEALHGAFPHHPGSP